MSVWKSLKLVAFLPTYCAQNLFAFIASKSKTNGDDNIDIKSGPINVLDTTPGNS